MNYVTGQTQDHNQPIPCKIRSVTLTAGAAAGVLILRPSGLTSYDHDLTFKVAAASTSQFLYVGLPFSNGFAVDIDGNIATYIIEYEPLQENP